MAADGAKIESLGPIPGGQSIYVRPLRMKYTLKADGATRTWDCVRCHESVAIVLYNETRDKLIFVKQLRPPVLLASSVVTENSDGQLAVEQNAKVSGMTIELCAGIIDKEGLTPEQIAQEEILEETGYQVPLEDIQFVASFRSGVGVTGSLQRLYYCPVKDEQRVTSGGGVIEECIEVLEKSREESKLLLFARDEDSAESRPVALLFALSWFLYEYWPKRASPLN
ncbi:Uridine diphosphate glucose pyrophosphatase NUDT14 [Halotydeus destructor]|nr:Uridine diphosphate glucose pyrophosphatase NUDT14 [Halotydeus destructor]